MLHESTNHVRGFNRRPAFIRSPLWREPRTSSPLRRKRMLSGRGNSLHETLRFDPLTIDAHDPCSSAGFAVPALRSKTDIVAGNDGGRFPPALRRRERADDKQ